MVITLCLALAVTNDALLKGCRHLSIMLKRRQPQEIKSAPQIRGRCARVTGMTFQSDL